MKPEALSIRSSVVWYVVLDLPYKFYEKKLKAIDDVRLYEVSPSSVPGKVPCLGMLVAGKTGAEAYETALDILKSHNL